MGRIVEAAEKADRVIEIIRRLYSKDERVMRLVLHNPSVDMPDRTDHINNFYIVFDDNDGHILRVGPHCIAYHWKADATQNEIAIERSEEECLLRYASYDELFYLAGEQPIQYNEDKTIYYRSISVTFYNQKDNKLSQYEIWYETTQAVTIRPILLTESLYVLSIFQPSINVPDSWKLLLHNDSCAELDIPVIVAMRIDELKEKAKNLSYVQAKDCKIISSRLSNMVRCNDSFQVSEEFVYASDDYKNEAYNELIGTNVSVKYIHKGE